MPAFKRGKPKALRFVIDLSQPGKDAILDANTFSTYLQQRIKVQGKAGNLGSNIAVTVEGDNIVIVAQPPFSKRYLKYLSKKFLKKHQLRDYIRVVASSNTHYTLKYYNIEEQDADAQ